MVPFQWNNSCNKKESRLLTEAALKAAKKHGVTASVDLNYRKKLWTEEEAKETMTSLWNMLMYA